MENMRVTVNDLLDISLLDYLSSRLGCANLSDLPRVSAELISRAVEVIPAYAFPLKDWVDAIGYLSDPMRDVPIDYNSAKQMLLFRLDNQI